MSRLSAYRIANELGNVEKAGKGWKARCPAHEDTKPSLSISETSDGKLLVHCHAGCSQEAVVDALKAQNLWPSHAEMSFIPAGAKGAGLERDRLASVPSETPAPEFDSLVKRPIEAIYTYRDDQDDIVGYVLRLKEEDGKSFRPLTPWQARGGDVVWKLKGFAQPLPIYGAELLARDPASRVLIVEGEKAVDAARALFDDLVVITWPGGSSSADKVDWEVLRARDVTLWPDADEPGIKAMNVVSTALSTLGAKTVRIVELPDGLPKGWDLADEAPEGFSARDILNAAKPVDPTLARLFLSGPELLDLDIPPQEFIIGTFMPTHSLSMVFAERGIGKTWFCMTLALAVARGTPFLEYEVPEARRVLYVDGEMALAELQERLRMLEPSPPDTIEFLPSELLYREDRPLNLHEEEDQARLLAAIQRREMQARAPEVIVIDNLSSLARGVDENSNSELDKLLQFLIGLRHRGHSVLLVHHAGKNKTQRGASRREDFLNLSIELRRPDDKLKGETASVKHDGAHFVMEFSKVRGRPPRPSRLDLKLRETRGGKVEWLIENAPVVTKADEVLRFIAERKPRYQSEIAKHFGVNVSRASQICTELRASAFIEESGRRKLNLTQTGYDRLVAIWPELAGKLDWQDEIPF